MGLKCVLWDFGDTLADEHWMQKSFPGVPDWPRVWSEFISSELADSWSLGRLDTSAVVTAVATRLGVSPESIFEHMQRCCSLIRFFETPLEVARRSSFPQAIVTINPDGFSKLIVPQHKLDRIFRPIVTSWEERTLDKGVLGLVALERLGLGIRPSEALLIDNKTENIEAWASRGGRGYHFRGEERFHADLESKELAASAAWVAA